MCTYRTTIDHVLFTVLDNRLLNKLSKQYKRKIDDIFNKNEEIQARKLKQKIGKEFLIEDTEDLSSEFDIDAYVNTNRKILQERGLNSFLYIHGWTMEKLYGYFTQSTQSIRPITSVFSKYG